MNEEPQKSGEEVGIRDEKGRFIEGHSVLGTRPLGSRNFNTLFREAIEKIAEEKKLPITDPEREMVIKAVVEALKGNFNFYKDIMDRNYGKAEDTMKLKGDKDNPIRIIDIND